MKTKLKDSIVKEELYGNGDTELYIYECPCGKGEIREEHENIPGFRSHDVWMTCDECSEKWEIDTSNGVRNWELIEKNKN